jgi:HSP20 family protein
MPVLDQWTPLVDLEAIERRMRRLFPELVVSPTFLPAATIDETPERLAIELEVPGFAETELEIELRERTLTIKGGRAERPESAFERSFWLPPEVETDAIEATYAQGVLTISAPKAAPPALRAVPITAG